MAALAGPTPTPVGHLQHFYHMSTWMATTQSTRMMERDAACVWLIPSPRWKNELSARHHAGANQARDPNHSSGFEILRDIPSPHTLLKLDHEGDMQAMLNAAEYAPISSLLAGYAQG